MIPSTVDWTRLSPEAAWTVRHLALPLACGLSVKEAAGQAGVESGWATKRLRELRREIEAGGGVEPSDVTSASPPLAGPPG
jgi:hypothetical protein